jgi:hypothetical protein
MMSLPASLLLLISQLDPLPTHTYQPTLLDEWMNG